MRRLEMTVDVLQARYGTRAVRRGVAPEVVDRLPSSLKALDDLVGGGLPRGRLTEMSGRASSGRTSIAMLAAAQASCGGQVAWVDASGDLDIRHLAFCGINLANLHLLKPRATSQAVAVCAELLVCGDFDLTVMDSLDHLDMRRTAGLVDHLMRRVLPDMARSVTVALFLSQPQTRLAGMAHAATLRLALQPQGVVWHAHRAVGWHTEVTVIKNRLGRAGLSARLFLPLPPP